MYGDCIVVVIYMEKECEFVELEELIELFLMCFVGKVQGKNDCLFIVLDYLLLKDVIFCCVVCGVQYEFKEGDWVVVEMCCYLFKGDCLFYVDLMQYIIFVDDYFVFWWVMFVCYNLEKEVLNGVVMEMLDEGLECQDFIVLNFVIIDSVSIEDMDDVFYVEELVDGRFQFMVVIVDFIVWIVEGSKLDNIVKICVFINYLLGFNIFMLLCELFDDLCLLCVNEVCLVFVCCMIIVVDGIIDDDIVFFVVIIELKVKLVYDNVFDWLENNGIWQLDNEGIVQQICLLYCICLSCSEWCYYYVLVFKDCLDYCFVFGEKGEVLDIVVELCCIVNCIVEELMIVVNFCVVCVLCDKFGFGIYNVYMGFDFVNVDVLVVLLKMYGLYVDVEEVLMLEGFCKLCCELDVQFFGFFDSCICCFQFFVEISIELGLYFGFGFEVYVIWIFFICKYGDMINYCLLKVVIKGEVIVCLQEDIIQ